MSVVPDDPAWDFDAFYKGLEARGAVIYPGKLTNAECFRLGSIGAQLRMSRVLMWRRSLIWHTRNANRLLVVADTCWFWWSRLQIGRMRPADMRFVTSCIKDVLTELGVSLPVTQIAASDPSPMTEVNLVFVFRPRPHAPILALVTRCVLLLPQVVFNAN